MAGKGRLVGRGAGPSRMCYQAGEMMIEILVLTRVIFSCIVCFKRTIYCSLDAVAFCRVQRVEFEGSPHSQIDLGRLAD